MGKNDGAGHLIMFSSNSLSWGGVQEAALPIESRETTDQLQG